MSLVANIVLYVIVLHSSCDMYNSISFVCSGVQSIVGNYLYLYRVKM